MENNAEKILIIWVHLNFAQQQGKVANWKYLKVSRTLLLELIVKLSSSSQLWKTILLADQWPLLRDRVGTSVNQKSAIKILNRSQANMKSMCALEETTPASPFQLLDLDCPLHLNLKFLFQLKANKRKDIQHKSSSSRLPTSRVYFSKTIVNGFLANIKSGKATSHMGNMNIWEKRRKALCTMQYAGQSIVWPSRAWCHAS